jgi:hypothetical protein
MYHDAAYSTITFASGDYIERISDLSGNSNDATQPTISEQPKFISGSLNQFDFSEDDERLMNLNKQVVANNFTSGGWFKVSGTITYKSAQTTGITGTSGQRYGLEPSNTGTDAGAGLSIGTNGIQAFEHGSNHFPCLLTYRLPVSADWHHILLVVENKKYNIYIDGVFKKSQLTSIKPNVWNPGGFGGDSASYGNYQSEMGNHYLFDKVLTPTEILNLYNFEKARFGH